MRLRGLREAVQRLRLRTSEVPPPADPEPVPEIPVAAPAPGLLDGFLDVRLVERRSPARMRDTAIEAPTRVQAEALEGVLQAIEMMMEGLGLEDSPTDIVITTQREFQILRFLEADPATYLFARLSREGLALPEARLRVRDLEEALDA